MYALFSALQLGFGIAVGENIVLWQPAPASMECEAPDLSIWWSPLWFAAFALGVTGTAAMLQDDVLSGMGFVFQMMVVGLSITIGLLLAKLALPVALFGIGKTSANNKNTLAAEMQDETVDSSSDEEEDMVI